MTKDKFLELKKKPNFLYLYFLESGGSRIQENDFNSQLSMWMLSRGVFPAKGMEQIEKYLINKHENEGRK
jgi:hypothetical protein